MMSEFKRLYTLAEMQEFKIQQIYELIRKLSALEHAHTLFPLTGLSNDVAASFGDLEGMMQFLSKLAEFLSDEELTVSRGVVDKIAEITRNQGSIRAVAAKYLELQTVFQIELSQKHFFRMSDAEKKLFQPDPENPVFGAAVQNNFPSVLYEIDEAAKCLALERFTASVFHLMRAMEYTLVVLRKSLELPDPTKQSDRNWGVILRDLRQEVERRNKLGVTAWRSHDDQHFFTDLIGSVGAVKLAWRDPTMHVERNFNQAEAKEVFAAVRTLMQKVASRINEDGMSVN